YTPYSHTAHPLSYRIPRPRLPTPFFSTHTPPPAIYPLSLHDALPIYLLPLRQPPRGPADGEQDREDVHREPHRLVNDPRVEVHIGVELPGHEVLVLERDALELHRDVDQRVPPGDVEHFLGHALDDLGALVVLLVDAMAEAEQPELPMLHPLDVGRDVVLRADLPQQPEHLLVRSAVQRPV